jgi:hypothetical protein
MSSARRPSTTLSLRLTWLTSTRPNPAGESTGSSDGASTAKPWLCEVTSTRPVCLVDHRLVDAAVTERQLVGAEPEGSAEQLVAEADAEERDALAQHRLQQFDMGIGCAGVARAVRVEHSASGSARAAHRRRGGLRQHVDVEAARGEVAQGRCLHTEVEHCDGSDALTLRRDEVGSRRWRHCLRGSAPSSRQPARPRAGRPGSARGIRAGEDAGTHGTPHRGGGVTARVSMPLMPTMPSLASRSSRLPFAPVVGHDPAGSRTTKPSTQIRFDSSSSSLTPVLPMCGAVITTIWPA